MAISVALNCTVASPSAAAYLSRLDIFAAITKPMRPMSRQADEADEPTRLVMLRSPRPMRPMKPMEPTRLMRSKNPMRLPRQRQMKPTRPLWPMKSLRPMMQQPTSCQSTKITSSIPSSFIFRLDGDHSPSKDKGYFCQITNNNQFGIGSGILCFRVAFEFES